MEKGTMRSNSMVATDCKHGNENECGYRQVHECNVTNKKTREWNRCVSIYFAVV